MALSIIFIYSSIDSLLYNHNFLLWPRSCTTSFKKHSLRMSPGNMLHSSFSYWLICYLLYEAFSDFSRHLLVFFSPRFPHYSLNPTLIYNYWNYFIVCLSPSIRLSFSMSWTRLHPSLFYSLFSPRYSVFGELINHKIRLNRKFNRIWIHFYRYQMVPSSSTMKTTQPQTSIL